MQSRTVNTNSCSYYTHQHKTDPKKCDHHRFRRQIICFRLSHLHLTVVAIFGFTPIKQNVKLCVMFACSCVCVVISKHRLKLTKPPNVETIGWKMNGKSKGCCLCAFINVREIIGETVRGPKWKCVINWQWWSWIEKTIFYTVETAISAHLSHRCKDNNNRSKTASNDQKCLWICCVHHSMSFPHKQNESLFTFSQHLYGQHQIRRQMCNKKIGQVLS